MHWHHLAEGAAGDPSARDIEEIESRLLRCGPWLAAGRKPMRQLPRGRSRGLLGHHLAHPFFHDVCDLVRVFLQHHHVAIAVDPHGANAPVVVRKNVEIAAPPASLAQKYMQTPSRRG
jgi:hypothetical protein